MRSHACRVRVGWGEGKGGALTGVTMDVACTHAHAHTDMHRHAHTHNTHAHTTHTRIHTDTPTPTSPHPPTHLQIPCYMYVLPQEGLSHIDVTTHETTTGTMVKCMCSYTCVSLDSSLSPPPITSYPLSLTLSLQSTRPSLPLLSPPLPPTYFFPI